MSNVVVNMKVVEELESLRASVSSIKDGISGGKQDLEGLRASVNTIKDGMTGRKQDFTDNLHDVLEFIVSNNIDGLDHYLHQLTVAVRENKGNDSEALRVQINTIVPHIRQAFASLAEDIKGSFQNGESGHNAARNELVQQTEELKVSNFELSLALKNVRDLGDIRAELQASAPAHEGVPLQQYLDLHDKSNAQKEKIQELEVKLANVPAPTVVSSDDQIEALRRLEEENAKLKAALTDEKSHKAANVTDSAAELRSTVEELQETNRLQEDTIRDQRAQIQQHDDKCQSLLARYRDMVDQLAEAKGNIRVMCRIRPAEGYPQEDLIEFTNPEKNSMVWANYFDDSMRAESREYEFQRAFGTGEDNQEVFDEVKDFAQSAALGRSCTIMAYGATGTGKSHTFLSSDGLVHNFIRLMFQLASKESGQYEYTLEMSAVEIYLNTVYDLLQTSAEGRKVEIKLTTESTVDLGSQDEAFKTIGEAINRREAASTKQNETSSRSHFIISVSIMRRSIADGKTTQGTTSFVDLAGSESVGKNLPSGTLTPQQALQLREGTDINRSLLNLGQNIKHVASKGDRFLPDHNLTRFLKSSLSQGSRLLVIVTVSPLVTNQSNTLASLRWAMETVGGKTTRLTASRMSDSPSTPRNGRSLTSAPSSLRSTSTASSPQTTRSTPPSLRAQASTRTLRNASAGSSSLNTSTTPSDQMSPSRAVAERRERIRERSNAESSGSSR
ncbi:hypothetical protein NPX13_g1589 [Xylaria arbuscula]|uniref:Kinesin motor domain-containing protein n=1 Tax=Xylaria arbuscula TaxID=114810 RepID=A0A9W8TRR0_9PEZI|nr:hypothetical protein NPX13_g1589 [Xylaria arbuscula]